MTVIAYHNGVMAADRAVSDSRGPIVGEAVKVRRFERHGRELLLGAAGSLEGLDRLSHWLWATMDHIGARWSEQVKTTPWPELRDDNDEALVVFSDSEDPATAYYLEGKAGLLVRVNGVMGVHAIGGGMLCALGAMAQGATPAEAVRHCCTFVRACAGGPDVISFKAQRPKTLLTV